MTLDNENGICNIVYIFISYSQELCRREVDKENCTTENHTVLEKTRAPSQTKRKVEKGP